MTRRFFKPGFITGVGVGLALKESNELIEYFGFVSGWSHLLDKSVIFALNLAWYGSVGLGIDYAFSRIFSSSDKDDKTPAATATK